MYEVFYGFREKPFSIHPDPSFLYFSRKHRMGMDLLEYGLMNQVGFNVITGGIGTGKTTLVRHLLAQVAPGTAVGLVSHTPRSYAELLPRILFAFRLDYRRRDSTEMLHTFLDFLAAQSARGHRALLIVDEAQNMLPETLEELRMLSNVNADQGLVLQVILVGQIQLREMLRRPDLLQFAQRIAVDYHLEALDAEETATYIRHRLGLVGGDPAMFDDAAIAATYGYSQGVPRLINLLCDTALVYGFAEQRPGIDADLIHLVAKDKLKSGLFPLCEAPARIGETNALAGARP
ncbi:MAG: AAA family ATPase [Betaproteobacteria bacterium]|nr:AAA family ATPase [Betaproteobacteria bacterium]